FLSCFRQNADKRIIQSVQNQRWRCDPMYDAGSGGTCIIVSCSLESAVVGCDLVIEIAKASNASHTGSIKCPRKQLGLGAKSTTQLPQKVILVQAIAGEMKGVGRSG